MPSTRSDTRFSGNGLASGRGLPAQRVLRCTGMPPPEYVHTLRLEEAKHMLETTDDSIEDIVAAVGYEDAGFSAGRSDAR